MGGPTTVSWPVFLVIHGGLTLLLALVAYLIRRGNYRKYPSDWFVGWVSFGLSVVSFAAAGVAFGLLFTPSLVAFPTALANAVLGGFVGNMLGDWIWWRYRKEINGDPDAQ